MFNVCKHAVLTLFALTVIKKQCDGTEDEETTMATVVMDDLKDFNMTVYCKFQANRYHCNNRRTSRKYFYDIRHQNCLQFEYGNCYHSYNMFDSRKLCLEKCQDDAFAIISDNVTANVFCRYQPDFGDCNSYQPSFYFDISTRKCIGFSYSGCGGNMNRFESYILCTDICETATKPKAIKV